MIVVFAVPGTPIPKGSLSAGVSKKTGKVFYRPANRHLPTWAKQVRAAAVREYQHDGVQTGRIGVFAAFVFERPRSHYTKAGRLRRGAPAEHVYKPDVDKLVRAILDALTGVVYRDDSQVVMLVGQKRWAVNGEKAHCEVTVRDEKSDE